MTRVSKPVNRIVIIKKESSRQFLHEFNKNQVTKEFMDSCKKAGELFERTRRKGEYIWQNVM